MFGPRGGNRDVVLGAERRDISWYVFSTTKFSQQESIWDRLSKQLLTTHFSSIPSAFIGIEVLPKGERKRPSEPVLGLLAPFQIFR